MPNKLLLPFFYYFPARKGKEISFHCLKYEQKNYRACILFSDFVRLSVIIFLFGYVMFVSQILRNVSEKFVITIFGYSICSEL